MAQGALSNRAAGLSLKPKADPHLSQFFHPMALWRACPAPGTVLRAGDATVPELKGPSPGELALWESRKPTLQTTREIRIFQAGISATKLCWLFCFFPDLGSVLPTPDLLCALGPSPWDASEAPWQPGSRWLTRRKPCRKGGREGRRAPAAGRHGARRQDQTPEGGHLLVLPPPGFPPQTLGSPESTA